MSLREITKDLHTAAEKTQFAKLLLSGDISKEDYTNYLYQLLAIYDPLEFSCRRQGFFKNMPDLPRLQAIYADFLELDDGRQWQLTPSTVEYHKYLIDLGNDPDKRHLMKAHMYCRHMGDLNGGQFIAKRLPFSSGKFYQFNNSENLKVQIRQELTDDLRDESRIAFEYAIRMMKELYNEQ